MGRIRTKDIKQAAKQLVKKYPDRFGNFEQNKIVLGELNLTQYKRTRNRIAGYIVKVVRNTNRNRE